MKIGKIRTLHTSPECISDVGEEDAEFLRKKVLLLSTLSGRISAATPVGSIHPTFVKGQWIIGKEFLVDMKDRALLEIDEMADKHDVDRKTFRNKCLSTTEYFSVTDTAAVPEPSATPVKKRASHVRKSTSSPAKKKSTRNGHVRKVFTPEDQPKKDKSKLVPKKGETRKGMNHCGRRTRGKNKRNRRRRGDIRSSRRRGGRKDCIPLSRCPDSVGSSTSNNSGNSAKVKSHDSSASCENCDLGTSQDKQWGVSLLLPLVMSVIMSAVAVLGWWSSKAVEVAWMFLFFMKLVRSVAGAVMSAAGAVIGGLSSKAVEVARLFLRFLKAAVSSVMSLAVTVVGWWSSKAVEEVFFFVELSDGSILQLKYDPDMQVGDVKAAVGSILGVSPASIDLRKVSPTLGSSCLRIDNSTLEDYNVQPFEKLRMSRDDVPGGGRKKKGKKKEKVEKKKEEREGAVDRSAPELIDWNLMQWLFGIGMTVTEVPGDGGCLFWALVDQLGLGEGGHLILRAMVCDHMAANKERFAQFLITDEEDEERQAADIDEHIEKMRDPYEYADNIEVVAASEVLQVKINIYEIAGRDPTVIIREGVDPIGRELNICRRYDNHYDSAWTSRGPPRVQHVAAANVERYIRDTSLAEDAVGNAEWSLKTILTVDQIGKVKCDGCCLDACCIWESSRKSHQPWYCCLDCQEDELEGFDDNPPPVKDDDGNLRATMLDKCHDPTKPQPTIPEFTCGDGSDDAFDENKVSASSKKEKKVTSSYDPDAPVPDNPFADLDTALRQGLASIEMYTCAMQVYAGQFGNYLGGKGRPILEVMQRGLNLVEEDGHTEESLERKVETLVDDLIEAGVKVGGESTRKRANYGNTPSADATGALGLNYATEDDVEDPQGPGNLMNRVSSSCIRYGCTTFPRHMVSVDRKRRNLEYEKQDFTLDTLRMFDLCSTPFTPRDKSDKAYYEKVDAACVLEGLTRSQYFLKTFILHLLQLKLSYIKRKRIESENSERSDDEATPVPIAFPFYTASKMTHQHHLGNIGPTTTTLVTYYGNVWHPEKFWRHFTKALPPELANEMNEVFGGFYQHFPEMDIEFEAGVTKAEFVQAWDKDVDEDTRQEMYEAQKRGREKGLKKMKVMKGDAAFIFHTSKEDGQDDEEALESVRDLLSEAHYNTYLASLLRGAMGSVAAAFVRAFEKLSPNDKVLFDPFSPHVTDRLIPHLKKEERAKYDNLLKHYKLNEILFKMESCQDGVEKGGDIATVAAAFSRIFDEKLDNDVKASNNAFSSEITSLIIPHLDNAESKKYDNLLKQYELNELLSKMKSHRSGLQKSIDSRHEKKTADGRSITGIKAAAKQKENDNGAAQSKKRKAKDGYLDKGMYPYSHPNNTSNLQPIAVECPRGDSCTRKGVRMSEHVFYDDGSGCKNSRTGYVASEGWKHVLQCCGATGCGKAKQLVPANEANKKLCISYDTVKNRTKKPKIDTKKRNAEVAKLKVLPKNKRLQYNTTNKCCKIKGCKSKGQGKNKGYMCKSHYTQFQKAGRNTAEGDEYL